jgi:hypothetical protein
MNQRLWLCQVFVRLPFLVTSQGARGYVPPHRVLGFRPNTMVGSNRPVVQFARRLQVL